MKSRREGSMHSTDFQMAVQSALGRLGALDTQQTALEEIKSLLEQNATSDEKITIFLNSLNGVNEHTLTPVHKKEFVKLYGYMAEVLEGNMIPFIPRVLNTLQKKLKEANPHLFDAISSTFGMIIHNTLHTLPDLPSSCNQLALILKPLFQNLSTSNKNVQICSAHCLVKIIQHSPIECLKFMLEKLSAKILEYLNSPNCRATGQLIEASISLILSIEQDFAPYAASYFPALLQSATDEDFATRKQALDALYTLAAVIPNSVVPFASEVMQLLNKARTDKIKPVRDSALEAISLYKNLVIESSPGRNDGRHSEQSRPKSMFKGQINPNFFKAAGNLNDGPIIEIAAKKPSKTAPPEDSPSFQDEIAKIDDNFQIQEEPNFFTFKEPKQEVVEEEPEEKSEEKEEEEKFEENLVEKLSRLESENQELKTQFFEFKKTTKSEISQLNDRLGALEEMITTVSRLFDAKLKQITSNPKIAALLS
ncbi:unnamed protein product [Blepharisma stoltei]|uniref:TORTIFOLIA1/SINE1-2 N-terminal domain-containing protein n=1 Tax=Blepharisma stoltei TaxID=1481888 RepID=A0AAU9JK87_9CILI|nr:unnamed protein product [Blepharisma stoltei]